MYEYNIYKETRQRHAEITVWIYKEQGDKLNITQESENRVNKRQLDDTGKISEFILQMWEKCAEFIGSNSLWLL